MNILNTDYLISTSQSIRNSQMFRKTVTGAVIASSVALGFLVALVGYRAALTDKVLYGVTIGGSRYDALSSAELHAAIDRNASFIEQAPITINQATAKTSLHDLDISINTVAVTRDALRVGRTGSIGQQLFDSFHLLLSPTAVAWQFEASDQTAPKLRDHLEGIVADSIDAKYQLENDAIAVLPDVPGVMVDVPATLEQMETTYLRGAPTVLRVAIVPSMASITYADLEDLQPEVDRIVQLPVMLDVRGKQVVASKNDILSWIRPVRTESGVQISLDDALVSAWVDQASAHVEQAPVDRQVLPTGVVVSAGRVGRQVDTSETTLQLKSALANTSGKPVIVPAVVRQTEPTTRIVAAETTAGLVEGKYVEVDLSSQMLYQYEGSTLITSYRVSTGKASTPTPTGTYTINGGKSPRAYSASFGLYLPSWMPFIGSTYGLHALPEWPNGYREGENHLGIAVSHGCVRLSTANAATLYQWADVGTTVIIHR